MKNIFCPDKIYHVFNRSIAHFKIFTYQNEIDRILSLFEYYNQELEIPYSKYNKPSQRFNSVGLMHQKNPLVIKVLGYCIMPDHYHLIIKTVMDNDQIIKYFSTVENAYAKYFNKKTDRHGHLWSESFKSVMVNSEEQFLYLTKYVHLNPVKAMLVDKPGKWQHSSFNDYVNPSVLNGLEDLSITDCEEYEKFVSAHREYEKKLEDLDKNRILID